MSKETTRFYKRLASSVAMKWDQTYSHYFLTSPLCSVRIRGSRSHIDSVIPSIDLATSELFILTERIISYSVCFHLSYA